MPRTANSASDLAVARIQSVLEDGKACAIRREAAHGPVARQVIAVVVMEWSQVLRRIRRTRHGIDDLPAKVGIGLAIVRPAHPCAAFVLAPQIGIDLAV